MTYCLFPNTTERGRNGPIFTEASGAMGRESKEEELVETGLTEKEEKASQGTRIKDPVNRNRHKTLTHSN